MACFPRGHDRPLDQQPSHGQSECDRQSEPSNRRTGRPLSDRKETCYVANWRRSSGPSNRSTWSIGWPIGRCNGLNTYKHQYKTSRFGLYRPSDDLHGDSRMPKREPDCSAFISVFSQFLFDLSCNSRTISDLGLFLISRTHAHACCLFVDFNGQRWADHDKERPCVRG